MIFSMFSGGAIRLDRQTKYCWLKSWYPVDYASVNEWITTYITKLQHDSRNKRFESSSLLLLMILRFKNFIVNLTSMHLYILQSISFCVPQKNKTICIWTTVRVKWVSYLFKMVLNSTHLSFFVVLLIPFHPCPSFLRETCCFIDKINVDAVHARASIPYFYGNSPPLTKHRHRLRIPLLCPPPNHLRFSVKRTVSPSP